MARATACIILSGISLLFSPNGLAYMGPTLGLSIVGTVLAIIAVLVLSITAFVVIPIRKLLKKSKNKSDNKDSDLQR